MKTENFDVAPLSEALVLDPRWLERALSLARPEPVKLRTVELMETLGVSCLVLRVRLAFEHAQPADLPEQMSIKGMFGVQHQEYLTNWALAAESIFYRDFAPTLSMFTPRCFYAGLNEENGAGVVILEDLIAGQGRFFSGLDVFTPDQVRQTLGELARLHGRTWDVSPSRFPRLGPVYERLSAGASVKPGRISELMSGSRGASLPAHLHDGQKVLAVFQAIGVRNGSLPVSFLHGDTHAGNVFQLRDRLGFLDWQLLQRGHWSTDVSYHIGAMLTIEDRRAHERDLLAYYLDQLRENGGKAVSWDDAWLQYRESMPYGFYMWAITQRVRPEIVDANVARLGTATADHESFRLLGN